MARDHVKRSTLNGDCLDIDNFYPYYVNTNVCFTYNDFLLDFISDDQVNAVTADVTGDRAHTIKSWKAPGRPYDDKELFP